MSLVFLHTLPPGTAVSDVTQVGLMEEKSAPPGSTWARLADLTFCWTRKQPQILCLLKNPKPLRLSRANFPLGWVARDEPAPCWSLFFMSRERRWAWRSHRLLYPREQWLRWGQARFQCRFTPWLRDLVQLSLSGLRFPHP